MEHEEEEQENLQLLLCVQVRPLKLASIEEGQTKRRVQTNEENPR